MSLPTQNAALLATIAVVSVALFPSGMGPFTATHGPVTALPAISCDAVDFTLLDVSVITMSSTAMTGMHQTVWEASLRGHEHLSILSLRC
jgi:hypothetical protein